MERLQQPVATDVSDVPGRAAPQPEI
nr:hypothetical protein [Escherichia coli]